MNMSLSVSISQIRLLRQFSVSRELSPIIIKKAITSQNSKANKYLKPNYACNQITLSNPYLPSNVYMYITKCLFCYKMNNQQNAAY